MPLIRFFLVAFALLIGILHPAFGQAPAFLSEQIDPQQVESHPLVWALAQDARGIMYAGTNDGVLIGDGARWRLIQTERPVRTLAVDKDGTVFVGCVGDVGRLMLDKTQHLRYFSIAAALPTATRSEREFKVYATENGVALVGIEWVLLIETGKLMANVNEIKLPGESIGAGVAGGKLYVNVAGKGLHRVVSSALKPCPGGELLAEEQLIALSAQTAADALLVTGEDRFFEMELSTGEISQKSLPELEAFCKKNQSFDLVSLSGGTLAVGSLRGGVAIANTDGTIRNVLRRRQGLPDQNIYALFVDRENGLWVCHARGITRALAAAPAQSFGVENGLFGTINSIRSFDGKLYAATVQGAYVRKPGGSFEPIAGLANEVWKLAVVDGSLLAAANDGIYVLNDNTAKRVVEASYVTDLIAAPAGASVAGYTTTDVGIFTITHKGTSWELGQRLKLDVSADEIVSLATTNAGELLVNTQYKGVFRLGDGASLTLATDTARGYPSGGATAIQLRSAILFSSRQGLFASASLDAAAQRARLTGELASPTLGRIEALAASGDSVVLATAHGPRLAVYRDGQLSAVTPSWAHAFTGRPQVAVFGRSGIYLGLQDQLAIVPTLLTTVSAELKPVIVALLDGSNDSTLVGETWWQGLRMGADALPDEVKLQPNQTDLRLLIGLPEYDQRLAHRYQTQVIGRDTGWSEWSSRSEVLLTGLAPGAYTVNVRARDAYGRVTAPASIRLSVATPIYLAWYAFVFYGIILLGLLFASGRVLSRSAEIRAVALEHTVQERTKEVKLQKQQIEAQVVELNSKNQQLDQTNRTLDTKNVELDRKNTELDKKNTELDSAVKQINAKNVELDAALRELKETQEQLVQQEKMASLGQLVAGVAHEINTPVGIGVTAASKLELRTKELATKIKEGQLKKSDIDGYISFAVEGCDMILKNLNRAAELIQSFKRVAVDQSADDVRSFKLHEYLHEVVVSISPQIRKSKVQVALNGDADLELITSPSSLSQILINLVMNSLTHGYGPEDEGLIRISFERIGNQLKLIVADDGKGIPADVLPKIFDPFFTTNRSKGGSGLGLHIVYNLVAQNLKGSLEVASEVGKGTTFTITMPIALA
jgi:signal transduction histidine kinase